jgi:hypothetical protein
MDESVQRAVQTGRWSPSSSSDELMTKRYRRKADRVRRTWRQHPRLSVTADVLGRHLCDNGTRLTP